MELLELVKRHAPVTGEQLAEYLGVSRPTLRSDLSLLVMLGLLDAKPKVGYFLGNTYRSNSDPMQQFHAMKVREVQGVPVNVPDSLSVHDAVITLFTENADTLLVIGEQKRFVGIVTPKDLLKITLGNPGSASIPVSMVMTRYPNIVTLMPDDSVMDAIRKMSLHQVDCLPVIVPREGQAADPEVTGWVSKSNIIRLLAEIAVDRELGEPDL
ncbi:helix-turn-helix transcriptional regulator [Paenibacillus sp. N4]|uniref:CBS domain-containing protein n=1 Tax=Paenibacillus vietnamensis TaxID=2590547 RepID=UPI001CD1007A|nr:CBS domain-containing protein [Paenibacillus vietnamensis]MCA0757404.1 helix-turn-helix transcriptional regulator [Paenibacillus vietnamensis]